MNKFEKECLSYEVSNNKETVFNTFIVQNNNAERYGNDCIIHQDHDEADTVNKVLSGYFGEGIFTICYTKNNTITKTYVLEA